MYPVSEQRAVTTWVLLGLLLLLTAVPIGADNFTPAEKDWRRLDRWLASPDVFRRIAAAEEVAYAGKPEYWPLLQRMAKDEAPKIRGIAAGGLGNLYGPDAAKLGVELLSDTDDRVRGAAALALGGMRVTNTLPALQRCARDDVSGLARFRAVWALMLFGNRTALPTVIDALTDEVPSIRERAALMALNKLADDTVPAGLIALATHPRPGTRRIVCYLLAHYGDDATTVPVLVRATGDADPLVRGEAALTLGRRRATDAAAALTKLLADPDEHVRGSAAWALCLGGQTAARTPLRPLLQDPSPFVRAVTAESLQALGDRSARPPAGFSARELFTYPLYNAPPKEPDP